MWQQYKDTIYEVSTEGMLRNTETGHETKGYQRQDGYWGFSINGNKESVSIVVADVFIPNPDNLPQVDHRDGDRSNNCVSNLVRTSVPDNAYNKPLRNDNKAGKTNIDRRKNSWRVSVKVPNIKDPVQKQFCFQPIRRTR